MILVAFFNFVSTTLTRNPNPFLGLISNSSKYYSNFFNLKKMFGVFYVSRRDTASATLLYSFPLLIQLTHDK